jgi:TetR/AcrR family transcriptional regulator, fatty acid metabolism regulator protein
METKVKGTSTKAAILRAAMVIFSKDDFNQATMRTIAQKAKIVPSNIYKYFENKDELLSAVLDIVSEKILDGSRQYIEGAANTREKISGLTYYYLEYYQNNPGLAYLIYGRNTLRHWYEYHGIYNRAKELADTLVNIILEGQKKGEVRKDVDLHMIGHLYHGGLRNLVSSWLYHDKKFVLSGSSEGFADNIYYAISQKSAGAESFVCPYYKEHRVLQ